MKNYFQESEFVLDLLYFHYQGNRYQGRGLITVMIAHCYLRDRNAHPDWLFNQGGSLSEAEQIKSLDSMILLSRFYGYMILCLAGFKGLKPNFPSTHTSWEPAATITTVSQIDSQHTFLDFVPEEMSDLNRLTKQLSEAKTYHDKIIIWRKFKRNK